MINKYEKALKNLKSVLESCYAVLEDEELLSSINSVQELLEKETAVEASLNGLHQIICPKCITPLEKIAFYNYCPHCGQRIDKKN